MILFLKFKGFMKFHHSVVRYIVFLDIFIGFKYNNFGGCETDLTDSSTIFID